MSNPLGQLPFPTTLAFEPVQLCNASCFCCPYAWLREDEGYRGEKMSRENIGRLLDDFGGIRKRHGFNGLLSINPYRFSDPLVCQDLDLIFEKAEIHDLDVAFTTNGVALNGGRLDILNQYRHRMMKINISFIGATASDIKNYMGISFDKVVANIEEVAANWPKLRPLIRVSLRVIKGSEEESSALARIKSSLESKGIAVKGVRENWITNRVDATGFKMGERPARLVAGHQDEGHFTAGCGWSMNLLQRMEVMVDGSVVLCCDDAEKHKSFGNVFEQGIEKIWTSLLRKEHILLMSNEFSDEKRNLICSNCTRAEWSGNGDSAERHIENIRYRNASLEKAVRKLTIKIRENEGCEDK